MTNTISQATILSDIWKNFFNRLKTDVTSVTITGSTTVTIQTYTSNFPDKAIDDKTAYPILIVDTPKISTSPLTASKSITEGTIMVDIYTNQRESAEKFLSLIIDSIETYKGDLSAVGIRDIEIADNDNDMVERGEIKIHNMSVTFSFKYYYSKTSGF